MAVSGFAVVCQPKTISFGSDHKLHRDTKDAELRAELRGLGGTDTLEDETVTYRYQPGGGCRLLGERPDVTIASVGHTVCAFQGQLSNLEALAAKHAPVAEADEEAADTVPQGVPTPKLTPAELICYLYSKLGVDLLAHLRGRFAVCMYESKLMRVLAARDGSGNVPLYEGRLPDSDALILTTCKELLEGCHETREFAPGDFKYGWHAEPRRYQPGDPQRNSRRSLDLAGHGGHHRPGSGSGRRSLDLHNTYTVTAEEAALVGQQGAPGAATASKPMAIRGRRSSQGGGSNSHSYGDHHASSLASSVGSMGRSYDSRDGGPLLGSSFGTPGNRRRSIGNGGHHHGKDGYHAHLHEHAHVPANGVPHSPGSANGASWRSSDATAAANGAWQHQQAQGKDQAHCSSNGHHRGAGRPAGAGRLSMDGNGHSGSGKGGTAGRACKQQQGEAQLQASTLHPGLKGLDINAPVFVPGKPGAAGAH